MMGFLDKVKKAFGSSKNFEYLDDLIHSELKEIILDSDIVLDKYEIRIYKEGIKLDIDDLIIDGNGHSIDAKGKTRIFHCTGKNIKLKNITLKNGFTKESGGAILNDNGDLTIIDSKLENNQASGQFSGGGAISNQGDLSIARCVLKYNVAMSAGGSISNGGRLSIADCLLASNSAELHYGGAISSSYGVLNIADSTLKDNTSNYGGGAIKNLGGELTITNSLFQSNSVKERGGAVYNEHDGQLKINECVFQSNNAEEDGGALYNNGSNFTVTESRFNRNSAHDGAVIYNYEGSFKIFNCGVSSNKSSDNIIFNNDYLEFYNVVFKDNRSNHIISNEGDQSNLGIFAGEFIGNGANSSVVCHNGKFCIIEKTLFRDNLSGNSANIINNSELTLLCPKIEEDGKTLLNNGYVLIRKSSPRLEGKIHGNGKIEIEGQLSGGTKFDFGYLDKKIHGSEGNEIVIDENIHFENYEKDYYEGGIELDIDNLIIEGNGKTIDAADKTRIFIITGKNITLRNITFINGHSHRNYENPLNNFGGAIKINHNAELRIENCRFHSNMSEENGGAIVNNGHLNISDSAFSSNSAKLTGGAICTSDELSIAGSILSGNVAKNAGALANNGELNIKDSTFTDNTAQRGGAIINKGEIIIISSAFAGNTSDGEYGGGGAIINKGELSIIETELCSNSAIGNFGGGAIRNSGVLDIVKSRLNENTTQNDGGAIENLGGRKNNDVYCSINDSMLNGNRAKHGGAIDNNGNLSVNCSLFINNIASAGGAICNVGYLNISDSELTDNNASSGGAIFLRDSKLFLTDFKYNSNNCTFKNNDPDDVYEIKD